MVELDEIVRQDLILYLLSKVSLINGYSKFYNLIYLLKKEIGEDVFSNYKFDRYFFTIRDDVLGHDLLVLVFENYVINRDYIESDHSHDNQYFAHSHDIQITKRGIVYLKTFRIDKKLEDIIGNEKLMKLENTIIKYNQLSTKTLMEMAEAHKGDIS